MLALRSVIPAKHASMPLPIANAGNAQTFAGSLALLILSAFLAYRQWVERRDRDPDIDKLDQRHFSVKDLRRWAGCLLMALIAGAMLATLTVDPRASRAAARLALGVWLAILLLLLALLSLAFWDWLANRAYAKRHRLALRDEQRDFWARLRAQRRPRPDQNGHSR